VRALIFLVWLRIDRTKAPKADQVGREKAVNFLVSQRCAARESLIWWLAQNGLEKKVEIINTLSHLGVLEMNIMEGSLELLKQCPFIEAIVPDVKVGNLIR
jgi:hypothetical protein